jgi:ubiquinone/menaquinone biosynthesis C-methylase UbiE
MQNTVERIGEAYDLIADQYDLQWSQHVSQPQSRLTDGLELASGERLADLGCGTGIDTIEMARLVAPEGEVVAVDCSQAMLDVVLRRADAAGVSVSTSCQGAEEFMESADSGSFDVLSLRFVLGYFDWRRVLAYLPRLMRANGRIGILTILAGSAPQAYSTYKAMSDELGLPDAGINALETGEQIVQGLTNAGAIITDSFTYDFRLSFRSGSDLAAWLRTSGIATPPKSMPLVSTDLLDMLWAAFGQRVEEHREGDIVPLDFHIAGVVARVAGA